MFCQRSTMGCVIKRSVVTEKMRVFRPSQIACTALPVHENSCMVLIHLCKNNLNLPIPHKPLCYKKITTTTTESTAYFSTALSCYY